MSADLERRFGGLRRLYGDAGYARIRSARVAVVGVGGVGSWAAEALARVPPTPCFVKCPPRHVLRGRGGAL